MVVSVYDATCISGMVAVGMPCLFILKSVGDITEPRGTPFIILRV